MNGIRVVLAAIVAFVLTLLAVTNVGEIFASLQSWSVLTAVFAAVVAIVVAARPRVRDAFFLLAAGIVVLVACTYAVEVPFVAAVAGVVALAALAACGAGLLFQSDGHSTPA